MKALKLECETKMHKAFFSKKSLISSEKIFYKKFFSISSLNIVHIPMKF